MKKRLDALIWERGLSDSRERAKAVIMSGRAYVFGKRVDKPGTQIEDTAEIEVRGDPVGFVSRGGLKLERALDFFNVDVSNVKVIDAGASTGGFTDCLLKRGAAKVYAVDVGYGQLAWTLRKDPRVVCMERTNVRYLTPESIGETLDFAVCDMSFISLALVIPPVSALLSDRGGIICLIKPQFEAGRENVGKKGVVRDPAVHEEVLLRFVDAAGRNGLGVMGITYSPVKGPEGNIEFLGYLSKSQPGDCVDVRAIVDEAHRILIDAQRGN